MPHLTPEVQSLVDRALAEDQAFADPTTLNVVPPDLTATGVIHAGAEGVLAGIDVALGVFQRVDPRLQVEALISDGSSLTPDEPVGCLRGSAVAILQGERTALNFLQRMSGIATETSRYVKAVSGTRARIVDTRKTAPGLRHLDKYAVRMGGGGNHRLNLADGILIKDNHVAALRSQGLSLGQAVKLAIERAPHTLKVEVEVTNLEELEEALEAGAHIVLLDNMSPDEMRRAVAVAGGRAVLEASGSVNLETVLAVAGTGVDLISVGALTHSVKALDMSLDLEF